jgi:hypothetical protein
MSITVRRTGQAVPVAVWDDRAMAQVASAALAAVVERTFSRGLGDDDKPMKAYSTRPTTISFASDTGQRLKPKGGLPAYGRGHPRKLLSSGGRAPRGRGWTITGRYYPGGYAEYKRSSRRGLTNKLGASGVSPDLVLSGELSRSVAILRTSRFAAVIGIKGAATAYGYATDEARPWFAHSPEDLRDLDDTVSAAVEDAMTRSARRGPR